MGDETKPPTYSELRQTREDEPSGGDFLRAKDYPNGCDVTVTGVEVIQNRSDSKFHPGEYQPYWVVNVKDGKQGAKLRETKPMSTKLAALGIADPTGKTFILATTTIQGNLTWSIARAL